MPRRTGVACTHRQPWANAASRKATGQNGMAPRAVLVGPTHQDGPRAARCRPAAPGPEAVATRARTAPGTRCQRRWANEQIADAQTSGGATDLAPLTCTPPLGR